MVIPEITLNNGVKIPQVGLGTWDPASGPMKEAIRVAIDAGYRHIDCAYVYQNEECIGEAIAEKINEGVVKREDLFLVSKLWCTFHSSAKVREGFDATLKALNTPYLDLYLIHAPYGFLEGTSDLFPSDADGQIVSSNVDFLDTWREMEKLVEKGLVRSIGISNFNASQTQRLLDNCKIKPVTNQVECHPYLNNEKLREFSLARGIVLTAYAPLGSPGKPWESSIPSLLSDEHVISMAKKYAKTPAQVLIRFAVQRGIVVIPKSTNPDRIRENFDVGDFELDSAEIDHLMALNLEDRKGRGFAFENCKDIAHFPFLDEF